MTVIATLGPNGSDGFLAAKRYDRHADLRLSNRIPDVIADFLEHRADRALIPVYNTREGEAREYFRVLEGLESGYWIDNVVLPINLSLGGTTGDLTIDSVRTIIGRASVFRQCEEFIAAHLPQATLVAVHDLEAALAELRQTPGADRAVIATEEIINRAGLTLLSRELAPYNRTRFAVIGRQPAGRTGYDATSIMTRPLADRVGLLVDILNEFTRRGINILDLRSENDIKTQKLQIYLEIEGHREMSMLAEALNHIEDKVIQVKNSLKVLGSFPRVDMRVKRIKSFGFIGSGAMTDWFAEKLSSEGYQTIVSGRTSEVRPEEMVGRVDVVVICVPISVTAQLVRTYGPLLTDGQALILLAGESETPLQAALDATAEGVEVMFVHNLWGPQSLTMKDKNVVLVKTRKSGSLCSEFESFLYKYGAEIYQDSAEKHDILMGVSQKLPTAVSVALAMTLVDHDIECADIDSHSTLTSLYGVLAMARVHNQNPRTYAEILATGGKGNAIVSSFIENLQQISTLAEQRQIDRLCGIIEKNRLAMPPHFLKGKMRQAQAVDGVLSDIGFKGD